MAEYTATDPKSSWWNSIEEILDKVRDGDTLVVHDPAQLAFDATDSDGSGVPDAVKLNVPAGVTAWVQAGEGTIQVALAGLTLPLPTLADGELVSVTFTPAGAIDGEIDLTLDTASLGNPQGRTVPVEVLTTFAPLDQPAIFLPRIGR